MVANKERIMRISSLCNPQWISGSKLWVSETADTTEREPRRLSVPPLERPQHRLERGLATKLNLNLIDLLAWPDPKIPTQM
jgi:hypothetical protein